MPITHLFAGKPQAFGPRGAPSSIIKTPYERLVIDKEGATEDEQGNKKLHGGPYMAIHQFAQESYESLAREFTQTQQAFSIGSIGENLSVPDMNEHNVFIGDQYAMGTVVLKVVSPRAPCSKINQRYGIQKVDQFISKHAITGWYYSVVQEGEIACGDELTLNHREQYQCSVAEIWRLRQLRPQTTQVDRENIDKIDLALSLQALSPEWQDHLNRVKIKLERASS